MHISRLALTAVLLGFATPACALTGEELLDGLREFNNQKYTFHAGLAVGYVSGASNVAVGAGIACPPTSISAMQLSAVAKKYIEDRPARWQLPADALVMASLQEGFPCKK
jgi:hypothetical protein